MKHKQFPQRKSPRLQGYDYTQSGLYFVTICTYHRVCHFGKIVNTEMQFTDIGALASQEIARLSDRWPMIEIDVFVVMPNHVHAIIALLPDPEQRIPTLGEGIGNFKADFTRLARQMKLIDEGQLLWQERYHDHIIRDEPGLQEIRDYILNNPARWDEDMFFVEE